MSCCGDRRRSVGAYVPSFTVFRWEGQGDMAVVGGVTGKHYEFRGFGSTQQVDNRDTNVVGCAVGLKKVDLTL